MEDHYADVVKALLAGRLVLVLGDGGIARDRRRPAAGPGRHRRAISPTLSLSAAERASSPEVSEYVALMKGVGPLYDELHDLFDRDFDPATGPSVC